MGFRYRESMHPRAVEPPVRIDLTTYPYKAVALSLTYRGGSAWGQVCEVLTGVSVTLKVAGALTARGRPQSCSRLMWAQEHCHLGMFDMC